MSAHTPGPWISKKDTVGWVVQTDIGGHVAAVATNGGKYDEANAYLIAAAPEMLDAIKGLLALCEKQHCYLKQIVGIGAAKFTPGPFEFDDLIFVKKSKEVITKVEAVK